MNWILIMLVAIAVLLFAPAVAFRGRTRARIYQWIFYLWTAAAVLQVWGASNPYYILGAFFIPALLGLLAYRVTARVRGTEVK